MAQMDALLKIRADTQGTNGIVAMSRSVQGIGVAAAGASAAVKGLAGSSALLQNTFGSLLPLLSAAGLVNMTKKTIEGAQAMYNLSQQTGLSVETLARFKKAAATSGTDIETVAKALQRLNKGLYETSLSSKGSLADALTEKGPVAEGLKALKISATDAAGRLKSVDQIVLEVADKFAAAGPEINKSAIAMQLFGKTGPQLIQMLNMGGTAIDKLKVKLTDEFAKSADQYMDKLTTLSGKAGALGADLAIALLPALESVTDAVSGLVTAFNAMPDGLKAVTVGGAGLAIAWGPLTALLGQVGKTAGVVANGFEILRYQAALAGGVMPMLAGGLDAVKVAMLALPGWGWAALGVTALAGLSVALYKTNDDFKSFVDNISGIVQSDFKNAMEAMGNFVNQTTTYISGAWNSLANEAEWVGGQIARGLISGMGVIPQAAQQILNDVGNQIAGLINRIPAPIRNALGLSAGAAVGSLRSSALGFLNGAMGPLGAYGSSVLFRGLRGGGRRGEEPGAVAPGGGAAARPGLTLGGGGGGATAGGGGGGRSGATPTRPKTTQELLGLSDAEMTAAVITALGEYGGTDPRGRTDVFANILARREAGTWGKNLLNVVTAPGQYAPNFGRSIAQLADPAFGRRQYGSAAFSAAMAELQNPALVSQSVRDIDSRLYFKGISEYRNMVRGVDFLRAPGQNFFHDEGAPDPGRAARTEALLARLKGAGEAADERAAMRKEEEERMKTQLAAAKDMLSTSEAALHVAVATDPLQRAAVLYLQEQADIKAKYADLLGKVKSEEEKTLLQSAEVVDLEVSAIRHKEQLVELTKEQLRLEKERIEVATRGDAGAGLRQGLDAYAQSLGNLRDATAQFTQNSLGALEGALMGLATTGKANFREFAVGMLTDLNRLIVRQLILKTIMDAIGGISGGGGAPAGIPFNPGLDFGVSPLQGVPLFGFAKGGIVSSPTLFKFANGGTMANGLMSEAGPEAIMPLRRGSDGRLGVSASGAAPITVNVAVDAKGSRVEGDSGRGEQLGRAISQAVQAELIKQKRPGGLLAT